MKPMSSEELIREWRWNLTNHTPTEEGIKKIEKIRSAAKLFAEVMIDNCPTSRDLSLALTSMEEATFHANASIARNLTDDKKPE
jgi:hypothetical protein